MVKSTNAFFQNIRRFFVARRRVVMTLFHLGQAASANYLAFVLRFETFTFLSDTRDYEMFHRFILYLPLLLIIRLVFYVSTGLSQNLWRYSSLNDLVKIIKSVSLGSILFFAVVRYVIADQAYPRSIYVLDWVLLIMLSGGPRLFVRALREYIQSEGSRKKILIIGAGDAGEMIVRDMKGNPNNQYEPIGFIDDDPYKKGLSIHGVPIFGTRSQIGEVIRQYEPEEILIAIPSANHRTVKRIYDSCKRFDLPIKILPGLSEILDGRISVSQMKPLSMEDLLHREPVRTDIRVVKEYLQGKTVLVTGAGGSIGSELCRQILEYEPGNLVLFDRYENGLFDVDRQLRKKDRWTTLNTVVGDMRDYGTVHYLFSHFQPQIIFHAAAHKHVPLMEHNPLEAVKNNVFGTENLVDAAVKYGADRFVLVSTDKAVNPTSIMGATKRIAEFLIMDKNASSPTKFMTVRFGNVLGSNGSVVHIFKEQISNLGPVTVTHPMIQRFFMLIPEAVQLVLTAGATGNGGEIFVLDMGEPIRIVDLAENLIRLSGYIPHEDIKIEFTGLRPGEKLYEELFDESEKRISTSYEKLQIAVPRQVPSIKELQRYLRELEIIVASNSVDDLDSVITKVVPNFRPAERTQSANAAVIAPF